MSKHNFPAETNHKPMMYFPRIFLYAFSILIAINSMPDHLHMFFGFRPHQSLADLMSMVKGDSSEWINKRGFTSGQFNWQDGYGAFSYEKKRVPEIAAYIENQELHHQKISFIPEYKNLLDEFGVDYNERFIFHEPI